MTEPFSIEEAILHGDDCPKYTARDMQAHAAQAVAAERERLQELNASQARMIETYLSDITRDQAEIGRLRAALADSCEEHRAEIYDIATGGGCMLLHDAVAAERERCAKLCDELESHTPHGEGAGCGAAIRAA